MRVGLLGGAAVIAALTLASPAAADRPNLVLIVTDDQTLASYDRDVMPKTKRLVEGNGTRFDNAFVTTPLCCPSRASMLTGQYGHNHGVLRNDYGQLTEKGNTLPVWLRKAGYLTMHVGRYLNFYEAVTEPHEVAPGWDEWRTITGGSAYFDYTLEVDGKPVRYGSKTDDYVTRVINARAAHLVQSFAPRPGPFFLQVDHMAPHQASGERTVGCKSSPIPDPRDADRFRNVHPPAKPSFNEADVSDKPSFIQALPALDEASLRRIARRWRCTLRSLSSVDRGVRDLFAALRREGELGKTVVILVSDNGYYFGEHRIPDKKHNPYEEAIRVPLVVRYPKQLRDGPRVPVVDETVANIDIAPTILQLAGAEPCVQPGHCRVMDGRSLVPLLRGETASWPAERELVVELERVGSPADVGGRACAYSGLRTPGPTGAGTLYVHHTSAVAEGGECEPVNEAELYDLDSDPFQLDNRVTAGSPLLGPTWGERLAALADCSGLPGRDPEPPSGRYCE